MPIVEVPGMGDVEFPDSMSDDDIAAAIRKNMGQPEVKPFPDVYAGAGGYNPMLGRLGGATQAAGEQLGMTPENTANPIKNAFGPAETGLQMLTGGLSTPIAGLAGIGQGVKNLFSPGMPAADRVRSIQEGMTYQPRTGAGQGMSRAVSAPGEIYAKGTNYLGEKATDITGSPLVGAAIKTAGDIAPMAIGARAANFERPLPRKTGDYVSTKSNIPTTDELRSATNSAYKRGEESGVMVKAEDFAKAADEIAEVAKGETLDPVLHPKSSRIVQVLQERKGKDLTLQEAENLRRIALEAEGDVNPVGTQTGDGRIAGKIVDELDDRIDALSVNDEARALNRRKSNSQLLDVVIERAQVKAGANYTQSGLENALRKEFQALALNKNRMKRLNAEQREAIKRVAMGGKLENTLRNLGKFDPTTGGMSAALSAMLGGGFAPATGGLSLALPVLGFAGKRGATRMALRNAESAREALVGRGMPSAAPLTKGNPTPLSAVPQGTAGRTPIQLQAAMALLEKKAGKLNANDPTQLRSIWQEFERLQAEIASSQGK